MASKVKFICANCSKEAFKSNKDFKKNIKRNTINFFCSKQCKDEHQRDEYSVYRYFLKEIKKRCRHKHRECAIIVEDLKELFDAQEGKCPYTGFDLRLNRDGTIYQASVDRKDSSIGYTRDNCQWVCLMSQYAKNVFDEEELLTFCRAVAKHRRKR